MEMIIFVGLPGSEKSAYYKNHFFNFHLRISNDLLKTKSRSKKLPGRNRERKGKERVPDCAIYAKAKIFEEPCMEEGFDEIIQI